MFCAPTSPVPDEVAFCALVSELVELLGVLLCALMSELLLELLGGTAAVLLGAAFCELMSELLVALLEAGGVWVVLVAPVCPPW